MNTLCRKYIIRNSFITNELLSDVVVQYQYYACLALVDPIYQFYGCTFAITWLINHKKNLTSFKLDISKLQMYGNEYSRSKCQETLDFAWIASFAEEKINNNFLERGKPDFLRQYI